VDANHPEFAGRFDPSSSCSIYDPSEASETHGTYVAGLAAAGGNNDNCAVGIAPEAMISACRVVSSTGATLADEEPRFDFFYLNMDNMDISQNSYGISGCEAIQERFRRRQLQSGGNCPFQLVDGSPCESCGTVADWSSPGTACEAFIADYCTLASLIVDDVEACYAYLTLFSKCQYTGIKPDEEKALQRGIAEGRDKKGIIYVFASGNDREYGSDVNMEGILTSRYTISVGGVMRDGTLSPFSIGGTALFLVAPAGSLFDNLNMISALEGGGCGDEGAGTSYSAPLVAGVIALMLEANPTLTWRDVQGILATTSRQTDPDDPSWTSNAAGLHHSNLYGFGIVDAERAVGAAKQWIKYTPEWELGYDANNINVAIPQSRTGPAMTTIQVSAAATFVTESVEVFIDVDHGTRGDLEIILLSPRGTKSILHPGNRPENSQLRGKWKMMTVKNWGEDPSGAWTLSIVDTVAGDLEQCTDYEWALLAIDGSGEFWTCNDLSPGSVYGDICENGEMGPDFRLVFSFADRLDDVRLKDDKGLTPAVGCCACGGGRMSSAVPSTLVSWSIAVHGHDPENQQGPPPPGAEPPSSSGSSIGMSMPAMISVSSMLWLAVVLL
jgi:subtilisin-like proprotein convertase family protein